jgi:hypothetical protein
VKPWGRWLAIVFYALTLCGLLYSPIFEHDPMDGSDIVMTIVFGALLIVFSLPAVGRQLGRSNQRSAVNIQK